MRFLASTPAQTKLERPEAQEERTPFRFRCYQAWQAGEQSRLESFEAAEA